jgi:hypothetical protein
MAQFIESRSGGDSYGYFVNADNVLYVRQSNKDPNKCTVFFEGGSIKLGISAAKFAARGRTIELAAATRGRGMASDQ